MKVDLAPKNFEAKSWKLVLVAGLVTVAVLIELLVWALEPVVFCVKVDWARVNAAVLVTLGVVSLAKFIDCLKNEREKEAFGKNNKLYNKYCNLLK